MIRFNDKLTLIFEGPDGCGKSTLIKRLKDNNYLGYIDIVDRGFISDRVYANKFNRTEQDGVPINTYLYYWEIWHKANRDTRIILCDADSLTLATRCKEKNDELCRNRTLEETEEILKNDRNSFRLTTDFICSEYKFPVLKLDTVANTEIECIEQIGDFIRDARV
jgi:thymidylate kinase